MQSDFLTPAQRLRVKELFDEAYEMSTATRSRWLAAVCANDVAVQTEVEKLLQAAAADSPLEHQPAAERLALPVTPALQPGQLIGPYRLLRELGRGGMGTVYLAERADKLHHEPVALKLVQSTFDREAVVRFQRERELLARLNHPNIARLLDGGSTETGGLYLVMEYVEGQPITRYCREHKVSLTERLKLFRTVCAAVQFAHQNFIVHRDLKPDNIFVTADGTPKLLDFGIAKLLESDGQGGTPSTLTRDGRQPFTPLYASPEQIRNETITTASDVYSLGVLLYELLTGARPYGVATDSLAEQIRAVTETEPLRPSVRLAELRGDLDNIVLKALQKEVAQRYATVEQLSDDLLRHLNGEPVTARPATWRYRAGKYVRRNRAFVTMASLLALTLLTVVIVTAWQLRASRNREREQRRQLYAADMRQAGQAWEGNNLVQMRSLLERHSPENRLDDEWRGFEWVLLWRQLHQERFALRHDSWTSRIALSSDGQRMYAGTRTGKLEIWDAQSGSYQGVLANHQDWIRAVALSRDGRTLASGGHHGAVNLWDAATGQLLLTFNGHGEGRLTGLTFSPDGTMLATGAEDGTVKLWRVASRELERTLPATKWVRSLQFSPDGRTLAVSDGDPHKPVRLWDVATPAQAPRFETLPGYRDNATLRVEFSADGQWLLTAGRDSMIKVWHTHPLRLRYQFSGHIGIVWSAVISPDGRYLASGGEDRTLRLWEMKTGLPVAVLKTDCQIGWVAFTPDSQRVTGTCEGNTSPVTRLWDVKQLVQSYLLYQSQGAVNALAFRSSDNLLAIGSNPLASGEALHRWFVPSDQTPARLLNAQVMESINSLAFSGHGKLAAITTKPWMLHLLEADSGNATVSRSLAVTEQAKVCFSPDGKTLVTGGNDGRLTWWEADTLQERFSVSTNEWIEAVAFAPDGRALAIGLLSNTVELRDSQDGRLLRTLSGHTGTVLSIRYLSDGQRLVSGSQDGTTKLWEAATGKLLHTFVGHADAVNAIAVSPDNRRLVSGSSDHTIRIWDIVRGEELLSLNAHAGVVSAVEISADGQSLVSGGRDGTVRLWRTAAAAEVNKSLSSSAKETHVWGAATKGEVRHRPSP